MMGIDSSCAGWVDLIKARRNALGLSQNAINKACGFKSWRYHHIERRQRVANDAEKALIDKALNAPPTVVVHETTNNEGTLHPELARLSTEKLDEVWNDRPAQIQVLRNIFYGFTPKVSLTELRAIKEAMAGRPLRDVATVAMGVVINMREVQQ